MPFNIGGIKLLLIALFGLAIMAGALVMVFSAHKAKTSKMLGIGANYVIAAVIFALGAGVALIAYGDKIGNFLLGG